VVTLTWQGTAGVRLGKQSERGGKELGKPNLLLVRIAGGLRHLGCGLCGVVDASWDPKSKGGSQSDQRGSGAIRE